MNRIKKIIIGAFLFVICVLVFQFFNNRKNIIEGHCGGGGGGGRGGGGGGFGGGGFGGRGGEIGYGGYGRGWRSGGYHGNNDYSYGVGDASDVDPVYVCDEGDNRDLCPYRYYGILY